MEADLRPRLAATAARCRTLKAELQAEHERRDNLVRRAIEEGGTYRNVAHAASLSVARVAAIMAGVSTTLDAIAGSGPGL